MPELPEVQTVIDGLRQAVIGKTIKSVRTNAPPTSIVVSPSFGKRSFQSILKERKLIDANRRGKNILIALSGDITLWVHLKMTGQFHFIESFAPIEKHDLVVIDFDSTAASGFHLRFNDYRRFGRLRLFRNDELWQQKGLVELGPEPLELLPDEFVTLCYRRPRMLKPALMDQSFIAGIGNIYADESLWASRLHPKRLTTSVSRKKLIELHGHIQRLLRKAIRMMGTTVDSYSGINGQTGRFQNYLLAYGREDQPCDRCGKAIVREKIGSRSAHFCPHCQRIKR